MLHMARMHDVPANTLCISISNMCSPACKGKTNESIVCAKIAGRGAGRRKTRHARPSSLECVLPAALFTSMVA